MKNKELLSGNQVFYNGLQVFAPPGVHEAAIAVLHRYATADARTLEIGSGAGAFTRRLYEQGFHVTASGIDSETYRCVEVPFRQIDMSKEIDSSYADIFDAIVTTEVIEHVENVFLFFRNARNLLGTDGILVLTTPNVLSLFSRLLFFKSGRVALCNENLMTTWGHIQILPEWLLRKAAEQQGFEWIESRGVGSLRYD